MSTLVIDSSVALAWCFEDERSAMAEAVLDSLRHDQGVAPALWALEVANVLVLAKRKGRIDARQMRKHLQLLRELPVELDQGSKEICFEPVTELAESCSLTTYDATYLELAKRLRAPLATLDRALAKAASKAGVRLFEEAAA